MKAYFLVAVTALVATNVNAECANACSGHGTCGARDACTCHKNWMANDCSQRVCPFAHAFVDSPKGDMDMSGGELSTAVVARGDTVYPEGTTEQYPDADANEGHFYMECANKGLCNRKTGDCACFDGYEGTACARTVCPDSCSGHGTCETIQELAEMGTFDTTAAHVASTTAFTYSYNLWDKEKTVGCKCDEGYFGNDCSMKKCKYGVDPLFESEGKRIAAEFRVKTDAASGSFKLKMYDVFGEDYITADINVDATVDEFCQAIDILPNGVFDMDRTPDNKMGTRYTNTEGDATYYDCFVDGKTSFDHKEACCHKNGQGDYTIYLHNNPGHLKTPEFFSSDPSGKLVDAAYTYANVAHISFVPGEYIDYFGKKMQLASQLLDGSRAPIATVAAGALTCADTAACAAEVTRLQITFPALMKLKNEVYVVTGHDTGVFTLEQDPVLQTQTLSADTIKTAPYIFFASVSLTALTPYNWVSTKPTDLAPNTWVFSVNVATDLPKESRFIHAGIVYTVYKVSADGVTVYTIENFIAGDTTGDAVFKIVPVIADTNFEYTTQCSNRGVCETSTGLCKCFKGYSNDNCDTQNAYAL